MKRTMLLVCALMLLAPIPGHAAGTTYSAPFGLGPQGGDTANTIQRDAQTGEIRTIRHQAFGISGGLGCGGQGAYSNFAVTHQADQPVTKATVQWSDGLFTSFSYVNVGIRKGANYVNSEVLRQPLPETTKLTVTFPPQTGTLTAWFGLQLSSSCPSVEVARAIFRSITFE